MTGAAYLEHGGESGHQQWLHSLETLLPILGGPPSEVLYTDANLQNIFYLQVTLKVLYMVAVLVTSLSMEGNPSHHCLA